jgi:hypothetical protein
MTSSDEPGTAHFLARMDGGERHPLSKRDLDHPIFIEASAHLWVIGKPTLFWLGADGYLPLPN